MNLKEFLELHSYELSINNNYEIVLHRINQEGEEIHLDYADNFESPWERYFMEYFDWEVQSFYIDLICNKPTLVIIIEYIKERKEVM